MSYHQTNTINDFNAAKYPQSISRMALGTKVSKMQFSRWPLGAILELKVKARSSDETNITNQILGPKYPISHKSHIIVDQIVKNATFKMATGRHIGFRTPKTSAQTFARVTKNPTLPHHVHGIVPDDPPNNAAMSEALCYIHPFNSCYWNVLCFMNVKSKLRHKIINPYMKNEQGQSQNIMLCETELLWKWNISL